MVYIFYVYILRCADDSLYTGYTNDVARRVRVHNEGKASKYTRARLPVEVIYSEEHKTKSQAMKREIAIKKLPREAKVKLIQQEKEQNT